MARIILHLGMHKTASTTLQRFCHRNRRWLNARGIIYPDLTFGHINHRHFGHLLCKSPIGDNRRSIIKDYWNKRVQPVLARAGSNSVLISYEGLFSLFWRNHAIERRTELAACLEGHDVEAVLYVRRQDEWYEALYNQLVKCSRLQLSFAEWVARSEKKRLGDIARGYRFWTEIIPKEKLRVRVFDRASLRDGDILADFASAIGLKDLEGCALPPPENLRLPPRALEIKRRLNRYGLSTLLAPVVRRLIDRLHPAKSPPLQGPLTEEISLQIMQHHRKGNLWLSQQLQQKLFPPGREIDANLPSLEQVPFKELLFTRNLSTVSRVPEMSTMR